jgi:hypothetical protein
MNQLLHPAMPSTKVPRLRERFAIEKRTSLNRWATITSYELGSTLRRNRLPPYGLWVNRRSLLVSGALLFLPNHFESMSPYFASRSLEVISCQSVRGLSPQRVDVSRLAHPVTEATQKMCRVSDVSGHSDIKTNWGQRAPSVLEAV